jgi:hypothetical protein
MEMAVILVLLVVVAAWYGQVVQLFVVERGQDVNGIDLDES